MKASDFANFYGIRVMLQFKETIALAIPGEGEAEAVPAFSKNGKPRDRNGNEVSDPKLMASQKSWPIAVAREPVADGLAAVQFTFVLTDAVVLPAENPELLAISYRSQDALIELMIDPERILSCQAIRARQSEQKLIAQA